MTDKHFIQTLVKIRAAGTFAVVLGWIDCGSGLLTAFVWAAAPNLRSVSLVETLIFQFVQAAVLLWAGNKVRHVDGQNIPGTISTLTILGIAILALSAVTKHDKTSLQLIAHLMLLAYTIWALYLARKLSPPQARNRSN